MTLKVHKLRHAALSGVHHQRDDPTGLHHPLQHRPVSLKVPLFFFFTIFPKPVVLKQSSEHLPFSQRAEA